MFTSVYVYAYMHTYICVYVYVYMYTCTHNMSGARTALSFSSSMFL